MKRSGSLNSSLSGGTRGTPKWKIGRGIFFDRNESELIRRELFRVIPLQ